MTQKVLSILSNIYVIIAISALIVLLIVWLIVQKVKSNKYKKQLQGLEVRYNKIKGVPLSFKLNKAVAISRVDPSAMQKVATTKSEFEKTESNLKQISQLLADTEDEILVGKLKRAKGDLAELLEKIDLGEKQVASLDKFLDEILEQETVQRQEVTELKNRFRDLKNEAQENSVQLSYAWQAIQGDFSEIEKMFSSFEDWMYASDFEKASEELVSIGNRIDRLTDIVRNLPVLLQDTRGVVPKMAEVLHHDYAVNRDRGVYLKHLEVEKNLSAITGSLKKDLENLRDCNQTGIREHLEDYKMRITQMDEAVKKESEAFNQLVKLREETENLYKVASGNLEYLESQYQKAGERLGLNGLETEIANGKNNLKTVIDSKPEIDDMLENKKYPASEMLLRLQKQYDKLVFTNSTLKELRSKIDNVSGDEDRAKKQIVKLQMIMNQLQVSIRKYKLPSLNAKYEEDMNRCSQYIRSLENLIAETPLNVDLLNSTLKEAIDYIYKCYNNVNNIVGSVLLIERTIVFGNRFRSTYPDIDSELTRAELSFRNGEYTEAITTAVNTVERIYPGKLAKMMVNDNAKGAE